jgi:hypothetical protein
MNDDVNLGRLLGRREAFTMVAARCSAADAALLRQIRDERLYLGHAKDWDEFCTAHLGMRRSNANRLIGLLNEFGPQYFEVAQLTRISPATYRAIAPSIRDGALHTNGEAIALIPENAERVAAAVAELRPAENKPARDHAAELCELCDCLALKAEEIAANKENWDTITSALLGLAGQLSIARIQFLGRAL